MKVVILYQPNSETDTPVQQYVQDFERQTGKKLQLIDAMSREGIEIARVHDILAFPAILATEDDGQFIQVWTEMEKWPSAGELSYYTR